MGQEQGVSPVIHAHDLTTIVWLKSPTAAPDLPRLQVIADSFAALNPSDELWRKYNDEIARLRRRGDVSTEEFHVLRYSIEARRALLAKTFGDPDVFTEGSVPAILEKARAEITADLRRQVRSERAAKREAQKLAQEAIASERAVRETAEKSVEDLRASLASDKTQREQALTRHAGQIGRFAVTLLLVLVGLVVAFGTFVTSDVLLPRSWKDALPPLEALSVGLVVLLSLASAVFGTSLLSLARGLETHLTPRVARILKTLSS